MFDWILQILEAVMTIPFQVCVGNCTSPALSFPGGIFPGGSRDAGGRIIFHLYLYIYKHVIINICI